MKGKKGKKLLGKKRKESKEESHSSEEIEIKKEKNTSLSKELQEMEQRNKAFIEKSESHPLQFNPPLTYEVYPNTKALKFEIVATFKRARAGILTKRSYERSSFCRFRKNGMQINAFKYISFRL